jgi:catechol-2,3-dioxygenase
MNLSIQTALLNVHDLERSIDFYRQVFDLGLVSQGNQVAALMINDTDRRQVVVLREVGTGALHAGRHSIGLRLLSFEVGSPDELEVIEQRLKDRNALVGQRRTEAWRAVIGRDPDGLELSISSSLTGDPIQTDDWKVLDEMVYTIGE